MKIPPKPSQGIMFKICKNCQKHHFDKTKLCETCRKKKAHEYYVAHKEEIKAQLKKYQVPYAQLTDEQKARHRKNARVSAWRQYHLKKTKRLQVHVDRIAARNARMGYLVKPD